MLVELYCALIVAIAFGGEAMFGFGGGLLAVPLLSVVLDVQDAVILVSIFQFLLGFLVFKNYKAVAWSLMPPLLSGMVIGVCAGIFALSVMSQSVLRMTLAAFILAFLVKTFVAPELGVRRPSIVAGGVSGFLGGFFQGCLSMGGPNVVMYLKTLVHDASVFRASMIFWLSVANVVRIPFSEAQGLYSLLVWSLVWKILPVFGLALFLGQKLHASIPECVYFRMVYALLVLASVSLVVKTVIR